MKATVGGFRERRLLAWNWTTFEIAFAENAKAAAFAEAIQHFSDDQVVALHAGNSVCQLNPGESSYRPSDTTRRCVCAAPLVRRKSCSRCQYPKDPQGCRQNLQQSREKAKRIRCWTS